MSRAVIVIRGETDRARVISWARQAPAGMRVEFKETKRSLPQNARMWAMLTDVACQTVHLGRKYTPDQWKVLFMHACGREVQFLPSLDGATFIPWGHRSSDLSKQEMSDLMEFIAAWGAEHGVRFQDPLDEAAA